MKGQLAERSTWPILYSIGAQYLGKNPPWKDVTVLVEGGRTAAGSLGRPRDETALRLNFTSFKKRNSQFCSDTEQSLSKYLASGSKLPFYTWYENRVKEHLPK